LKNQIKYIPGLTRQFSTSRCLFTSENINSGDEAGDEKNSEDKESSGYESSNPEAANPEAPRSVSPDNENTVEERVVTEYLRNKDPRGVHRMGGPVTESDEEFSTDSSTVSDWKERWKYTSQEAQVGAHADDKRQRNADDYGTAHYANDRGYQKGKISKEMYELNKDSIEKKYAIKKAAVDDRENATRHFIERQTAADSGMEDNFRNADEAVTSGSELDDFFEEVPDVLPPSSRIPRVPRINTELFQDEDSEKEVPVENTVVSPEEKVENNSFDTEVKGLSKRKREDSDENSEIESNLNSKKLKINNDDSDNNGGPSNQGPSGEGPSEAGSLGMEGEPSASDNTEFSMDNDVERQITEINDVYILGKPYTDISDSDNITNIVDFFNIIL
jgi:hypothetical protein